MGEDERDPVSDPTGGPSAGSTEDDKRDDLLDPSAGSQGGDRDEGAVEETRDRTGDANENPG